VGSPKEIDVVEIGEPGEAISESEIGDVERKWHVRFPDTYRHFLLKYNGGIPSPDTVDVPGAPGSPTDVQVFFGVRREVPSSTLAWNREMFVDRIPGNFFPIACDSGGNLFCVSLNSDPEGAVHYCDLENSPGRSYLVARDFESFLAKLKAL
jgi:hypothetical protein